MSDITLTAGMRANLISLQGTADLLNRTQARLASGNKVNSALDNPVNFFAAQAATTRANDLTALKDNMSEAIQGVTAADAGIKGILGLIDQAKSIANSAKAATDKVTRTAAIASYDAIRTQIDQLAGDSGYKGSNFLASSTLTVNFNETGTSSLNIVGADASTTGLAVTAANAGWDTAVGTTLTSAEVTTANALIDADIAKLDAGKTTLQAQSQTLSANLSVVSGRLDFTSSLVNVLTDGASKLTRADLNEEGANMLALQTRNQLGITSLSLASQANQSVLRLFP